MALLDTLIVFGVSLLIGAFGINVGARLLTGVNDYWYAIVTALIASAVWIVVELFFGWVPLLGAVLALGAYIGVIDYRYPGGWLKAIGIALVAWLSSLVVLFVLGVLGLASFGAMGIPGV